VIDIDLMNKRFNKPKDWKEEYEDGREYF